jgi:hypothetical protein
MILSLPIGGLSSEAMAAGPKRELIDHHETLLAQKADVGYGTFTTDLAGVLGWLMSALPRNDNTLNISLVPRMPRSASGALGSRS